MPVNKSKNKIMKNIKVLLIFILFSLNTYCQYINSLAKDNILGKVSKITKIEYSAFERKGEIVADTISKKYEVKYNEDGNEIEAKLFSNNDLDLTYIWKYDFDNYIMFREQYDNDNKLVAKNISKLDSNYNVIELLLYWDDTLFCKYNFEYDSMRNYTIFKYKMSDENLRLNYKNSYDKKGNLIRKQGNYSNGDFYCLETHKYNLKNKPINSSHYEKHEKLEKHFKYKYNIDSYLVEEVIDEIKEKGVLKIIYFYDLKGNWIKKTTSKNGILQELCERIIEYQ